MAADELKFSNSSKGGSKRTPHRHTIHQTQRLESCFEGCQHASEWRRYQLAKELGLTPNQVKFWFQNKRTLWKSQEMRAEGNALRKENKRLKIENLVTREVMRDGRCGPCKGISKEEYELILQQLRMENAQLVDKYEQLCNLLASVGISVSKTNSLPPSLGSPSGASQSLEGQRIGGLPLDHDLGSGNPNDHAFLYQQKQLQYSELSHMAMAIANATNELSSLLVNEPLWIRDPIDGKYVIHRKNYANTFARNNQIKGSRARFESSKVEGIVGMNATQLVGMLLDSTKRLDLFPTIITKAVTLQEIIAQMPGNPSGSFQLVYEQMNILSPLVVPRDFYVLRYCHPIGEGAWMIVEVSHDTFNEREHIYPSHSRKLPSGCVVRDLSNGCSAITWVEHVEVDDNTLTHQLYREIIFRGLAYGAEKWLLTLQRMCERFSYEMIESQGFGEGKRSIMNLSHRMVKILCANLTLKNRLDVPHILENNNVEVRFSVCKSPGVGQSACGLIVNAATTFWLPLPFQEVFNFLRDEKTRSQWDVLSEGNPFQEIASISYGDHPGNRISIFQPLIPSETTILVLQESCIDPLGAIVAFAPIETTTLDMAVSGADSSNIPMLPSGFIISGDGQYPTGTIAAGASSSTATTSPSGSLLTVVFQILDIHASSLKNVNMKMVSAANDLIISTVEKVKSALNCTGMC